MEPASDLNIVTLVCLIILVAGAIAGVILDIKDKAKK